MKNFHLTLILAAVLLAVTGVNAVNADNPPGSAYTQLPLYSNWQALPQGHMFGSHGVVLEITHDGRRIVHVAIGGGTAGYITHLPAGIVQGIGRAVPLQAGTETVTATIAPGGAVILLSQPRDSSWVVGRFEL